MKKVLRWMLLSVLTATPSEATHDTQARRGSLVVWIVSERADYVVIGAESREVNPDLSSSNDRSCKIISLGGDTLFYGTGNVTLVPKHGVRWSSKAVARSVYVSSRKHDASDLSSAWGTKALRWFYSRPQEDLQELARPPHGSLVIGGFINFNDKAILSLHSAEFSYDSEKHTLTGTPSSQNPGQIGAAGIATDLVKEFFDGRTERAVRAFGPIAIPRLIAVDSRKDVDLVRKAIQFAMDNSVGDDKRALGGDIDIAIIRSDRTVEWVTRKSWCSEQDWKPSQSRQAHATLPNDGG